MRAPAILALAAALAAAGCGGSDGGGKEGAGTSTPKSTGIGVERAALSPTVDHPYVAFASVRRAVYEGHEVDPETGERIELRVESEVRDATRRVAGVEVTVVDVSDYEDGELVERTDDYYAQHRSGDVYYLGEDVDEYEDGEVAGHGGAWRAGGDGARAGLFMPTTPEVGDEFEQERAPGLAEDRSTVVAVDVTVTVPAGTFEGCIETEDLDPIDDVTEHKVYCEGVGLVREVFPEGGSLDLVSFEH